MKLQDAYVAEKGTRVGNWKEIGYLMQNTSNFFYCDLAADCAGVLRGARAWSARKYAR
ncbi:hypothetical protein [Fibrobacter sp. UWH1]|uniref:hypothetical protein n=1 Tax=Fibrobacter sp. UWH1 TaxID=1964354 RepID=UPI0015953DF4|nr:hypothetical protein [Fibrobacter sp. UWH1]